MSELNNKLFQEKMDFQREYADRNQVLSNRYVGTIYTKDYEGGFYITADEKKNSLLKPSFLEIPDVDTLKKLGGNSDELYVNNLMEKYHEDLPEWKEEKTEAMFHNLSLQERSQLCKAFQKYVYGYSNEVTDYKDALNKYYFPMKIAMYQGEDIVVSKDNPLFLQGDGEQGTVFVFNSITFEKGGNAVVRGNVTVIANKYISEALQDGNDVPIIFSEATSGTSGGLGGTGGPGKAGTIGVQGNSGSKSCSCNAVNGGNGDPGNNGTIGGQATNGSLGSEVHWTALDMSGVYYVCSYGGNGGNGGKGGTGGKGGAGGNSAAINGYCSASNPGYGGRGGNGGAGGNGGDGGDGGIVEINNTSSDPSKVTFTILTEEQTKSYGKPTGRGGEGGVGGDAGAGGDGGDAIATCVGPVGDQGTSGTPGKPGKPGTIYINGRKL